MEAIVFYKKSHIHFIQIDAVYKQPICHNQPQYILHFFFTIFVW